MDLLLKAVLLAALAALTVLLWQYLRSGRYLKARNLIQRIVADVLRETNQGTFLFVVSRNARSVEVQINAGIEQLRAFEALLSKQIQEEAPGVESSVVQLQEDLSHLGAGVVVWGHAGGDVYVARGHAEHPV